MKFVLADWTTVDVTPAMHGAVRGATRLPSGEFVPAATDHATRRGLIREFLAEDPVDGQLVLTWRGRDLFAVVTEEGRVGPAQAPRGEVLSGWATFWMFVALLVPGLGLAFLPQFVEMRSLAYILAFAALLFLGWLLPVLVFSLVGRSKRAADGGG